MILFSWRKKTMLHAQIAPKSFAAAMKIEEQLYKNCSENTMGWPMRGREDQGTGFGSPELPMRVDDPSNPLEMACANSI